MVADTFDAVTHSRRYRAGQGLERAVQVLAEGRGTQFDPAIIDLALLPPVLSEMSKVRIDPRKASRGGRKNRHESIPDVTFRWRSESLGMRRVPSARHAQ